MKSIKLSVIGMSLFADGSAAVLTKVGANNPSPNGVHVLNAAQIARIATRALGFNSPIALKQAIAVSSGSAVLSIDTEEIAPGTPWENKVTGETGIHKGSLDKATGEYKAYTKYSNHELELGFAASMKILEIAATASINAGPQYVPVQAVAAKPALGITNDTKSTDDAAKATDVEP